MNSSNDTKRPVYRLRPPLGRTSLRDVSHAWVWLLLRLYAGLALGRLAAEKLASSEWNQGAGVQEFASRALATSELVGYAWTRQILGLLQTGDPPVTLAGSIALFQLLLGILLVLGAFTGPAALLSAGASFAALLFGAGGVQPVLLVATLTLTASWRVAGYYGLDFWLLPLIGTPWSHPLGKVVPFRSPWAG